MLIDALPSGVLELVRLAKTLSGWRVELLAYFTTGGASNGPTEAMNLLIKKIKRAGNGFRNFDNSSGGAEARVDQLATDAEHAGDECLAQSPA